MQLLTPEAGRRALRGDGRGAGDVGRVGGQQHGRESPRWAATPPSSARSPTTSSAMIFEHDMHALGVRFDTPPLIGGPPTGRCLILVTPDAQRTMNTCPGASHELTPQRARRAADCLGLDPLPRRLSVGPGKPARGDDAGDRDRACGGTQGRLHPVRKRVHRRPQGRLRRDDRQRRGRPAVRQRGRGAAADRRAPTSTVRWPKLAAKVADAGRHPRSRTARSAIERWRADRDSRCTRRARSSTRPARATCSPPASSPRAAGRPPGALPVDRSASPPPK